jgi:glycosyltransferase involved in cell wall biosynthesis
LRLGSDLPAIPAAIRTWLANPMPPPAAAAAHRPPVLSVIIPVYNGADFLAGAVASVLAQGWESPELIIVDDGSTDTIEAAVAGLPIEARLLRQDNAGPAAARNRGIRNATGELIAFLDVDDLWPAGRLAAMWDAFERDPGLEVVQGHAQVFREAGMEMEYLGNPGEAFRFSIAAGLYRRAVFSRVGLFDPELRFSEDEDWFHRARECGACIAWEDMVTLLARRHERNMTRGRSIVEVDKLRVFRKMLERKRDAGAA